MERPEKTGIAFILEVIGLLWYNVKPFIIVACFFAVPAFFVPWWWLKIILIIIAACCLIPVAITCLALIAMAKHG